jgi:SAM-dependent methyltransferase
MPAALKVSIAPALLLVADGSPRYALSMTGRAPADVHAWPGEARRHPSATSSTWVVRSAIARWLEAEAAEVTARGDRVRILDVGCGVKPYYPFFAHVAASYVGVDVVANPNADVLGAVEDLPIDDASFDLVLCNQVLEHCDDPARAVRELHRVTAPGGRVLASTHGVQVYHPSPHDYWRWTHEGLARLFQCNAAWEHVAVVPGSGTAASLAMLLGTFIEIGMRRAHLAGLARGPVWVLNRSASTLDRSSALLREPGPGALFANLHVTASV